MKSKIKEEKKKEEEKQLNIFMAWLVLAGISYYLSTIFPIFFVIFSVVGIVAGCWEYYSSRKKNNDSKNAALMPAILIMIVVLYGSITQIREDWRIKDLRENNPNDYLAELKTKDEKLWLDELKILKPVEYKAEVDRRQKKILAAQSRADRDKACLNTKLHSKITHTIPTMKISIDFTLKKRISKYCLELIADAHHKELKDRFENIFLAFVLEGQDLGGVYWATAYYTPEREIKILSLTIEQYEKFKATPIPSDVEIVAGPWLWHRGVASTQISFIRKDNKLYIRNAYADGSGSDGEAKIKNIRGIKRHYIKGSGGDYYVIEAEGKRIGIYDAEGLIGSGGLQEHSTEKSS